MPAALVLEKKGLLALREIDLPDTVGEHEVKVRVHTVGVCGSDVHYYVHGGIGDYVVRAPMVLGHEGAGTVVKVGSKVQDLKVGDRVCMEPGVPDLASRSSKMGRYNIDPSVTFWATPPDHGILTDHVVHPAAFTYKLPSSVSFSQGAMVEPFAVGLHAATRARVQPGDVAVVIGAGTIGIMTALAALAGGCSSVIISDINDEKLTVAQSYPNITGVNVARQDLPQTLSEQTDGWGADIVFEASGNNSVFETIVPLVRPGGALVLVGLPDGNVPFDVNGAIAREIRIETVFRYANIFERALELIASGKVNLKPLVSATFTFEESIAAFERAAEGRPGDIKLQIAVDQNGDR